MSATCPRAKASEEGRQFTRMLSRRMSAERVGYPDARVVLAVAEVF